MSKAGFDREPYENISISRGAFGFPNSMLKQKSKERTSQLAATNTTMVLSAY